jgi:hypothetical protein
MGDFINNLLDNLISTTWRLMDLPLYFLLLMILALTMLVNRLGRKWLKKISDQKRLYINVTVILLILLVVVDKKIGFVRAEITGLNEKIKNTQFSKGGSVAGQSFDLTNLKTNFPDADVRERSVNGAIQLIAVTHKDPNSVAYIARIDMTYPGIEVEVSPEKKGKYLTSQFAKEHNCMIAINGEAGESMAMDCALGQWSGNWVSKGNPVLMADNKKRPFMAFNKRNKGKYYEASFVDTNYNDNYYNTIWGRVVILKEGKINKHEKVRP